VDLAAESKRNVCHVESECELRVKREIHQVVVGHV
jgi:hypothetical protein